MPSSLSHAMVSVAAGSVAAPKPLLRHFIFLGAICAVLPDIDAVGRPFGLGDLEFLGGHRGFTHSWSFAAMLGVLLALSTTRGREWDGHRIRFAVFIALVTASHGALDYLSRIGAQEGVQFLSPFSTHRFTQTWHPINGFFGELFVLFIPLVAFTVLVRRWRRSAAPSRTRRSNPGAG